MNALAKVDIFRTFMDYGAMGGLMITRADYGSDALNIKPKINWKVKNTI
jgi:hypothetical protein